MKQRFPYLVLISALLISCTGSFFSIYGLGKLFGGHQTGATIIAFAFEFGNVITATALKLYWNYLSSLLKYSLVVVVFVLTILTSMGIYGYLSDGYQKTAMKDEVVTKMTNLVKVKKETFENRLSDNKKELESINNSLQELSKGFNQNTQTQQVVKGQVVTNVIVGSKKGLESQMNTLNARKYKLDSLNTTYLDSIQSLELSIIEIENNNEAASELGPLKFLSDLSGTPMNKIVNWLILVIVIIFQPLAIMLLITSMFAFENNNKILIKEPEPVVKKRRRRKKIVNEEGTPEINPEQDNVKESKKSFTKKIQESITNNPYTNDIVGKAQRAKDKVLSFNMENLMKELERDSENTTSLIEKIDTATGEPVPSIAETSSALADDPVVLEKPKAKRKKKTYQKFDISIPDESPSNIEETPALPTEPEDVPVEIETTPAPTSVPAERKGSRKRKIVDTELNAEIADHIKNSLQNKNKKKP
jgi:hypothetical protein